MPSRSRRTRSVRVGCADSVTPRRTRLPRSRPGLRHRRARRRSPRRACSRGRRRPPRRPAAPRPPPHGGLAVGAAHARDDVHGGVHVNSFRPFPPLYPLRVYRREVCRRDRGLTPIAQRSSDIVGFAAARFSARRSLRDFCGGFLTACLGFCATFHRLPPCNWRSLCPSAGRVCSQNVAAAAERRCRALPRTPGRRSPPSPSPSAPHRSGAWSANSWR